MRKPLQLHLLKRVPPACKGERTMRWRGRPPIGGQDSDGASYRCSAPYTLCLFEAFPSRGNEKIGGTGYCVTYDTESQSRNVLASPLGEEGHEVAKGWTVVILIMILDVDVTAERRHYNTHRPRGRYHNPRPEGPSNLRTLRPIGPVHLKNLHARRAIHNPFTQPAAIRRP